MQTSKRPSICLLTLLLVFQVSHTFASPAACQRNLADKFIVADLVLEATVTHSRRWKESATTVHLVAKYQVLDVFKGDVSGGSEQIVTATCIDRKRPNNARLGYPGATPYCPGGLNIYLTGVDSKTGHPKNKGDGTPNWILFLKKNLRKGAPQTTWKEVSGTSFVGGCRRAEKDIAKERQAGFGRMMARKISERLSP